jgi:protein involved in polysaccharide export with SLBB domain
MIAALKHPGGYEDIRMREGDLVLIPKKPATISIVGAVVLPSAVIYQPRKTIAYYVQKAGGFTEDAAIHRMIVVKPYGTAIRASRNTILELGDTVYVPTSVIAKRFSERDLLSEIQSTLIQLANTVATVAILRSLSGCCGY